MFAPTSILAVALAWSSAPPLSDQQRADLAAARDDADSREQPFFALVQNVRSWSAPSADDEPIRLAPDLAAMVARPQDFRGELCRITGELLQHTPLGPPYDDIAEWFVRDARSGTPLIVYVVQPDTARAFKDRERVQIDARFYKRMHFAARDRKIHDYPAFVGRFPIAAAPAGQPGSSPIAPGPGYGGRGLDLLAVVAGPVAVLAIVLMALRAWAARKGKPSRAQAREGRASWLQQPEDDAVVDESAGLSDDPAEALAELRRRATEATSSEHARDQGQSSA